MTVRKNTKSESDNAFWMNVARPLSTDEGFVKFGAVILESLARITSAVLIFAIVSTALSAALPTAAFYNDTEKSEDNIFVAGEIDFTATSTPWNPIEKAISMAPGDSTEKTFIINPLESNPFQYFISTTVSGDTDFCDGLQTIFSQDAGILYSGNLSNLLTATTTSLSEFNLSATGGANNSINKICDFELSFTGWQTRHGFMSLGGYSDIEIATGTLTSWGFRINKVYYDVAPDRGVEGDNEWVEIYNQTDTPLDLSGWEICDNHSCDIIPAETPLVPAMGYAWITNKSDTASATGTAPWYLPDGVVYIPLNNLIGNGLANTADMLILKRPDGVIIDQMNWGIPDTGWNNYNDDVWNPGVANVSEGNVLARIPSGYDTNQPSDWKELGPPSVDLIYPDEDGSYTWYWTHNYTITWTATNPNGPDEDLNISLFYIKDVNHDSVISLGDTTHIIVSTTTNDGSHTWKVPSGFTGYIWIKLVATGPENPFLNSSTISGLIYDPIPLYLISYDVDSDEVDTIPPMITLNGNNPAVVPLGSVYADLGAVITDNVNSNLGYETLGTVDTDTLGEYTLTYRATDQMGNVGTATRIVIVYDPALGVPEVTPIAEDDSLSDVEGAISGGTVSETTVLENEQQTASTTNDEIVSTEEETATSTPEILPEELSGIASTTDETLPDEETASTTPETLLDEGLATSTESTASSTPPALSEESIASSTEPIILEEAGVTATLEVLPEETAPEESVVTEVTEEVVLPNEEEDEEEIILPEDPQETSPVSFGDRKLENRKKTPLAPLRTK